MTAGDARAGRPPRALTFLWVAHVLVGLLHLLVLAPLLLLIIGLAGAGSHQGWQGPSPMSRAAPLLVYGIASIVAGLGLRARRLWAALLALLLPLSLWVATVRRPSPAGPWAVTPLQRLHLDLVLFARDVPWLPLAWLASIAALLLLSKKSFVAR